MRKQWFNMLTLKHILLLIKLVTFYRILPSTLNSSLLTVKCTATEAANQEWVRLLQFTVHYLTSTTQVSITKASIFHDPASFHPHRICLEPVSHHLNLLVPHKRQENLLWDGRTGYLDEKMLSRLSEDHENRAYICRYRLLIQLGVQEFHLERDPLQESHPGQRQRHRVALWCQISSISHRGYQHQDMAPAL